MKVVYIAGPLSDDVMLNTTKALDFASELLDAGYCPIVPHLTVYWNIHHWRHYEEWMDYDLELISRSDCLFRMPGDSPGADREVQHASEIGVPVFYTRKALDLWAKMGVE